MARHPRRRRGHRLLVGMVPSSGHHLLLRWLHNLNVMRANSKEENGSRRSRADARGATSSEHAAYTHAAEHHAMRQGEGSGRAGAP